MSISGILAVTLLFGTIGCFLKACAAGDNPGKGSEPHVLWWMATVLAGCGYAATQGAFGFPY